MKFHRLLLIGLGVSIAVHGAGSAYFNDETEQAQIAAAPASAVSVVGSLADLVAGAKLDQAATTEKVIEPLEPPTPREAAQPAKASPREAVQQPVQQPVEPTQSAPRRKGVTEMAQMIEPPPDSAAAPQTPKIQTAKPVKPAKTRPLEAREPSPMAAVTAESTARLQARPLNQPLPQMAKASPVEIKAKTPVPVEPKEAAPAQNAPLPEMKPKPPARPAAKAPAKKAPKKAASKAATRQGAKQNSRRGGEVATTRKKSAAKTNGRENGTANQSGQAAKSNYIGQVLRRLRRAKRYPRAARRANITGAAVLRFVIARNGAVSGVTIVKSSGKDVLDKAVLDMVKRASPMPAFPEEMPNKSLTIKAPIQFSNR